MINNKAYTEYLRQLTTGVRTSPVASLEIFLLNQGRVRQLQREADKIRQFVQEFDWQINRDYNRALQEGYTLVLTDRRKEIIWVSHSFLTMTGYAPNEAIGKTPRILQGPDTDQTSIQRLTHQLAQAVTDHRLDPIREEMVNYRKGGEPYRCALEIDPLRNQRGELTHYIAVEREV